VSAYLELRNSGRLGDDGAALLYRTAAAVIRFDRLPPPSDHPVWTQDAVREVAHDFLADPRTTRRLSTIMLRATDDDSLGRLLEAAVRNYLRDRSRQSDHGAFRRRLREVLSASEALEVIALPVGEAWTTPQVGGAAPPYTGSAASLDAAAWSIETPIVRWRSEARRSPTDAAGLAAVAEAVIETAGAPITTDVLVEVGLRRFSLANTPAVADLDDDPPAGDPLPDELVADRAVAAEAFEQLTARERQLLRVWDQPVRDVANAIGLGRSAAAVAVRRLEALLTELLDQHADPDTVWVELQHLAHAWAEHRTERPDASSADS
jgi:hypothetical protein